MDFEGAGPSVVRSIRQRVLLDAWLRLYVKTGQVPPIDQYEPDRMAEERQNLGWLKVDQSFSPPRITFERESQVMAAAYGEACKGRPLDEYLGPRGAIVLPVYYRCIERALPAYTIFMYHDVAGRPVAYERLLLPFATDGRITDVLASHNNISEDGKFEANNLIRPADPVPAPTRCAIIDRDFFAPRLKAAADDVIEI